MAKYFVDRDSDVGLEADNFAFWDALLGHIGHDLDTAELESVLDVGCHRGGLLERVCRRWKPRSVYGIEPLDSARGAASKRLVHIAPAVRIVSPSDWDVVPAAGIHVLTCHEVLYLVDDLDRFLGHVRRVLSPHGAAYIVHGCHPESPVWSEWSVMMKDGGIAVHEHAPLDVLSAASRAGLSASIRPLRRDGWVRYDPTRATYRYPSVDALFEHHFRQKLLIRLVVA